MNFGNVGGGDASGKTSGLLWRVAKPNLISRHQLAMTPKLNWQSSGFPQDDREVVTWVEGKGHILMRFFAGGWHQRIKVDGGTGLAQYEWTRTEKPHSWREVTEGDTEWWY